MHINLQKGVWPTRAQHLTHIQWGWVVVSNGETDERFVHRFYEWPLIIDLKVLAGTTLKDPLSPLSLCICRGYILMNCKERRKGVNEERERLSLLWLLAWLRKWEWGWGGEREKKKKRDTTEEERRGGERKKERDFQVRGRVMRDSCGGTSQRCGPLRSEVKNEVLLFLKLHSMRMVF